MHTTRLATALSLVTVMLLGVACASAPEAASGGEAAEGSATGRMPNAAEAVANLRGQGSFRFEATLELAGSEVETISASGVIDLAAAAARYHPAATDALREQGVIALGRRLYVPEETDAGPDRWIRATLGQDRASWVEEDILPLDGGALLGLRALADVQEGGDDAHLDARGHRCSTAPVQDGTGDITYCVYEHDRLRSLERVIEEGSVAASYDDPGVRVRITEPPPDRVTDAEFDETG